MSNNDEKTDYLEVDSQIPGQNWTCLSFLSPESMIQSKQEYALQKFLQSYFKDKDVDVDQGLEDYKNFLYKYQDEIQNDFDKQCNFKNNIRGIKVRGSYLRLPN